LADRLRGRAGVKQRTIRKARTDYLCEMCLAKGRPELATVVDHIIPLSKGGLDEDTNTRNLCTSCHLQVTARQFGYKKPKQPIGVDGWPIG
jgi:5-methylcytosine-specific restriction protein A